MYIRWQFDIDHGFGTVTDVGEIFCGIAVQRHNGSVYGDTMMYTVSGTPVATVDTSAQAQSIGQEWIEDDSSTALLECGI